MCCRIGPILRILTEFLADWILMHILKNIIKILALTDGMIVKTFLPE